ncbi:MAG: ankyrin repeat domain-containing protein [Marinilabiliaceae bacterium]|nr:ankyrin repeat domain-containing protein [Marinilabiliaceae bacterium]
MNNELKNLELLDAAFAGGIEKVRSVLDKGLNAEEVNFWGKTAMKFAIKKRHTAVMELLLERGIYTVGTGLYASIYLNDIDVLLKILENTPNAVQAAFKTSITQGNAEILKTLLDKYCPDLFEKDKDGKTLLDIVIYLNDIDVLLKLLENTPNAIQAAFRIAINQGNAKIFKTLFNKYCPNLYEKDNDGKTLLNNATAKIRGQKSQKQKNRKLIVELLTKYKHKNEQLILACKCLNINNVKMYLKKGANPNFKNEHGNTALEYTQIAYCTDENALKRQQEIINLLRQ